MIPVPVAVKPVTAVDEAIADQVKFVPATFDVRFTKLVAVPEQIACTNTVLLISGLGFTLILYSAVGPAQAFAVGVMV